MTVTPMSRADFTEPNLFPANHENPCPLGSACPEAVTEAKRAGHVLPQSRWFITAGHPGFNSPSNNALGYLSTKQARAAIRQYEKRAAKPSTQGGK